MKPDGKSTSTIRKMIDESREHYMPGPEQFAKALTPAHKDIAEIIQIANRSSAVRLAYEAFNQDKIS